MTVLICVRSYFSGGTGPISSAAQFLSEFCQKVQASSIYKTQNTENWSEGVHDIKSQLNYEGLVVVLKAHTDLGIEKLVGKLVDFEQGFLQQNSKSGLKLEVLCSSDAPLMTPRLSIPHPELHTRPDFLFLSAELWPEYVHPILKRSLLQLKQNCTESKKGEFFLQGQRIF